MVILKQSNFAIRILLRNGTPSNLRPSPSEEAESRFQAPLPPQR